MEGLNIKEFLEREGERLGIRTQEELAAVLGVSDQTVSNWVNAVTFPPHRTEYRLLTMGMTIGELFGPEIWEAVKKQALSESDLNAEAAFERKAAFLFKKLINKIDNVAQI